MHLPAYDDVLIVAAQIINDDDDVSVQPLHRVQPLHPCSRSLSPAFENLTKGGISYLRVKYTLR